MCCPANSHVTPRSRLINADQGALGVRYYHMLNLGLIGLAPAAIVAPQSLTFPLDMAIAVAFPLHGRKSILNYSADIILRRYWDELRSYRLRPESLRYVYYFSIRE